MLKHVRQLGRNKASLQPAVCQLTAQQYQTLLQGLEKLQVPGHQGGEVRTRVSDKPDEVVQKAKRELKEQPSEVSLNSTGMPNMFRSPLGKEVASPSAIRSSLGKEASPKSGLKRPAASSQLVSFQRAGSRLHEAMGYGLEKSQPQKKAKKGTHTSPTGLEKPESASTQACMKKPGTSLGKGKVAKVLTTNTTPGVRKPWVDLKQTNAKNPPRAYIQGSVENGRKHLIVQVTQGQTPHYLAIIGKIREALEKSSLTKQEALEMRGRLLDKYKHK